MTIAGSDSGGAAGLEADLKTFLICGVHGTAAITAVTVQNSLGVTGVYELPANAVAEQIEAVATDIGVGAAKTGMLANAEIIEAVADAVGRCGIPHFVVDPVCASQHGDPLLAPNALDAIRDRLFPMATLVTPNIPEIRLLTGLDVRDRADMSRAARVLKDMGPQWVIVKGGHLEGPESVDVLYDGEREVELSAHRYDTRHDHGTGDTLAAATCAGLARGLDLESAVRLGKTVVTRSVADAFPLGAGRGPVGHFWAVHDPL